MTKKKNTTNIPLSKPVQGSTWVTDITVATDGTAGSTPTKGRKNKGGKLIPNKLVKLPSEPPIGNIIIHLKCSMADLEKYNKNYNSQLTDPMLYTPDVPPEIQTYETISNELQYNYINQTVKETAIDKLNYYPQPSQSVLKETGNYAYTNNKTNSQSFACSFCKKQNSLPVIYSQNESSLPTDNISQDTNNSSTDTTDIKTVSTVDDNSTSDMTVINQKLKNLKIQLIKNKINDKKSACFWCSYDFDNPECYIPCYELDNTIGGYGSFCRPECAVAYLMKESIDDTTKFDRYNLLNQIYGKIYNYSKNIKPAPNPFYLLEKYYGNLTIEEYRKLLKSNHLLMVIEKPMTRVFPELHEENDNFFLSGNNQQLNTKCENEIQYKVKRSNDKKNDKSKLTIIQEHFGI